MAEYKILQLLNRKDVKKTLTKVEQKKMLKGNLENLKKNITYIEGRLSGSVVKKTFTNPKELAKAKEVRVEKKRKAKQKNLMRYMLYTDPQLLDEEREFNARKVNVGQNKLIQRTPPTSMEVTGDTSKILMETYIHKVRDDANFDATIQLMLSNSNFAKSWETQVTYVHAIYVMTLGTAEEQTGRSKEEIVASSKKQKVKYSQLVGLCNRRNHVKTIRGASTFDEMIVKKPEKDSCYIDAVIEAFGQVAAGKGITLDYNSVLKRIHMTKEDAANGISFEEMAPFFTKSKTMGLQVFSPRMEFLFGYNIEAKYVLNVIQKNNHVYRIVDANGSLSKGDEKEEKADVKVSSDFKNDQKEEDIEKLNLHYIYSIDEIPRILDSVYDPKNKEMKFVNCVFNGDVTVCAQQLVALGYEPSIYQTAGQVKGISLNLEKYYFFSIKSNQLANLPHEPLVDIENFDEYKLFTETYNKTFNLICSKNIVSFYDEEALSFLERYRTTPIHTYLSDCHDIACGIDQHKCYTSHLMQLDEIASFTTFDIEQPYDGHDIQDFNLYVVEADEKNSIALDKTFNLLYGKYVKKLGVEKDKIKSFKKPSSILKTNFKKAIENLYKTNLTGQQKKFIANAIIGILEKKKNTKTISQFYQNPKEARDYAQGQKVQDLISMQTVKREIEDPSFYLDNMEGEAPKIEVEEPVFIGTLLFKEFTNTLQNGYLYIKEMLLQNYKVEMQLQLNKLTANGITVYGIKTDCFVLPESQKDAALQLFDNQGPGIGQWELENKNTFILPGFKHRITPNHFVHPATLCEQTKIQLDDEFDSAAIASKISACGTVQVTAKYPGCGKTTCFKNCTEKKLFVCPTNKLLLDFKLNGFDAMTLDKLMRVGAAEYEMIVFDEIYFHSIGKLMFIKKFVKENAGKIFGCTGDDNQLEPIEFGYNNYSFREYYDFCLKQVFGSKIHLTIPKRVQGDDRQLIKDMYEDLFEKKMNVKAFVKKYFGNRIVKEVDTDVNICYENDTCKIVADTCRAKHGLNGGFQEGEHITCRKHLKVKKDSHKVNYEYVIIESNTDTYVVQQLGEDEKYIIPRNLVEKNFISSFASTCHSFQGQSVDDAITVFDWTNWYVSRNWIWVAITRCRDLSKVFFFDDRGCDSVVRKQQYISYCEKKIMGYMKQDKDAAREFEKETYATVDCLLPALGSVCPSCESNFFFDGKNSNVTLQRIDNELPHSKDNCHLLCCHCNCSAR